MDDSRARRVSRREAINLLGAGAGGREHDLRGDDLRVRLALALEEIATGVEKRVRVKHLRPCAACS